MRDASAERLAVVERTIRSLSARSSFDVHASVPPASASAPVTSTFPPPAVTFVVTPVPTFSDLRFCVEPNVVGALAMRFRFAAAGEPALELRFSAPADTMSVAPAACDCGPVIVNVPAPLFVSVAPLAIENDPASESGAELLIDPPDVPSGDVSELAT